MAPDDNRRLIPQIGDWGAMRAAFRWNVPRRYNIAERCCDSWARVAPDRVAIIDLSPNGGVTRWTYGQINDASDRLANALAARGLGRGDRLAVLLSQSPAVLISHFAAMKLGAIVVPLFTLFGQEALRYRLADSGACMLVCDPDNLDKVQALRGALDALREVYVTGDADQPVALPLRGFWAEIAAASGDLVPVQTLADDPAVLIYTSGTTGSAKGVLHAYRFLIGHLPSIECHHKGFGKAGDVGWTPADWAWIGGLMDMAMPCLYYGVPLISHRMRKFDPEQAFALIARHRVRNLMLPPTALRLMSDCSFSGALEVRSVASGGESLGADLLDWGRAMLGAPINEIYGQTECNLVLASCHGSMPVRAGSMGQAVPGFEVSVIDADGQPLAPGNSGEIAVKSPNPVMFLRYWNKPEQTAAKYVNGWLKTGDLGQMDADGYFTFAARDDDVITSSGYRIGPTEIENCLTGHDDVAMAAVIGVPDAVRTEAIKAFVVLREGADQAGLEAELVARVRKNLSPHMAPRSIEVIGALPMTATGKIRRRELRDREVAQ